MATQQQSIQNQKKTTYVTRRALGSFGVRSVCLGAVLRITLLRCIVVIFGSPDILLVVSGSEEGVYSDLTRYCSSLSGLLLFDCTFLDSAFNVVSLVISYQKITRLTSYWLGLNTSVLLLCTFAIFF